MSPEQFQSVNPATGELLQTYAAYDAAEVDRLVQGTARAFTGWKTSSFAERRALLDGLVAELEASREHFAALMNLEMGKALAEGRAEIDKCILAARFYSAEGEKILADRPVPTEARSSFISYQPLGVVLLIMPWNFPFWQVLRVAIPALFAGNTILLKHASNVSGCSLALEKLVETAARRKNLFRSLLVSGSKMESIIARDEVAAVSFTGSTTVGRSIGAVAGANLKKSVLELGGSDPHVILGDADVSLAASLGVKSRLINGGQSCIAAKRFIVVEKNFNQYLKEFKTHFLAASVPPLARGDLRKEIHEMALRSTKEGASLVLGGALPSGAGFFYPATILSDVGVDNIAFREEIFGPVAVIVRARDDEEAIRLANQTSFGLGAAVFTADVSRGQEIARTQLEAGSCFVNDFVRSDPRLPFGGIKQSGYGRELADFGMREFVNVKTVWVGK